MEKLLLLLVLSAGILLVSCEKNNNQPDEPEPPEEPVVVIDEPFITGNIDIDNYIELDPPVMIVNDCINDQLEYYYCVKPFDFTLDGINDFGFSFSGNPDYYWSELNLYIFSDYQVVCNENDYVKKLSFGDTIHHGLNWKSGDKILMTNNTAGCVTGDVWYRPGDGFVGFRNLTENDTIMGWFRITKKNLTYEIKDYGLTNSLPE